MTEAVRGHYVAVTADVPLDLAERASFLLHEEEAGGVELRDGEVLPPPGMAPPPPGRAIVVGYFGGEADGDGIVERLREALAEEAAGQELRLGAARLPEEAWAETWKLHFKPLLVSDRIWVLPPWEPVPSDRPVVVIEPGMAFGTGGHATTKLCLAALVESLAARPGATVLDVGCGSGILAIGAVKLGAGRTVMVDNDPIAVAVAAENSEKNGCARIETSTTPVEELAGSFDVVVANILANTLCDLAAPIAARVAPGGELFLSGILLEQGDEVQAAYVARGLVPRPRATEGEWVLLSLRRD